MSDGQGVYAFERVHSEKRTDCHVIIGKMLLLESRSPATCRVHCLLASVYVPRWTFAGIRSSNEVGVMLRRDTEVVSGLSDALPIAFSLFPPAKLSWL